MVAILVLLTIVGFLLADWTVQLLQARRARFQLNEAGFAPQAATALLEEGEDIQADPYLPPRGLFFHQGHCWAQIEQEGMCRVGMDGLIAQLLGRIDAVTLPIIGTEVREGDTIARIRQGDHVLALKSPVDGTITGVNDRLKLGQLRSKPYSDGWLAVIQPKSLGEDARKLVVGDEVVNWHKREFQRIADYFGSLPKLSSRLVYDTGTGAPKLSSVMEKIEEPEWQRFQEMFMEGRS
jgi:glycine cleavage system H lipoate-binding protein